MEYRQQSYSEKRKYPAKLSSILAVCFEWNTIEIGTYKKLVYFSRLALYMLNQSKLNLGRHICLSICLWLDRNGYLCEEQNSNRDIPTRLRFVIFSFGCNNSSTNISQRSDWLSGKMAWKTLLVRLSAKDETKWNAKNGGSLKLLILFLFCFLCGSNKILLHWYIND